MAYYTNLINAWNAGTVPGGVTGSPLSGMTAQKLALINAWTVTGVVPAVLNVTGMQLMNCVNYVEFKALTAAQQQNLLLMFACPGLLIGGSAETAQMADGILLDYFNHAGPTIAALTALAQGAVTPWWQNQGYTSPFNLSDLAAAGGLT